MAETLYLVIDPDGDVYSSHWSEEDALESIYEELRAEGHSEEDVSSFAEEYKITWVRVPEK